MTGNSVHTAANGDELFTTFSGTATFPNASGVIAFDGVETVTGGTGRFEAATGSFTGTTRVNVFLGIGEYEIPGTMSY